MKRKKKLPGTKRRGIYETPHGPGLWNPTRSVRFTDRKKAADRRKARKPVRDDD